VVLIAALLQGFTPFRAVSVSLAVMLVASFLHRSTRLNPAKLLAACTGAAKGGMALVVAAACVGIILGVVSVTPLSSALPKTIQSYAGDGAILPLLMLMFSTIIHVFDDHSGDGIAVGGLLPVDGELGRRGVGYVGDSTFGRSFVYFLFRDDVDGDTTGGFGGLCGGGDIGREGV